MSGARDRRLRSAAALALLATLASCTVEGRTGDGRTGAPAGGRAPVAADRVTTPDAATPERADRPGGPGGPAVSRTDPLRGSFRWHLDKPATNGEIAGFADAAGAPPGTRVLLHVSTGAPRYRVEAFRIGAYRGGTGRKVWDSGPLAGVRQQPPAFADYGRRTVVAPWRPTVVVDTSGWQPGLHVFLLTGSTGYDAHVPYVVRSPSARGRVALVAPVTTWQAYNDWGGYSLYDGLPGDTRSHAVSFDRPYPAPGAGEMRYGVAPVVVAAERLGIPLAYLTNVDLHTDPAVLRGARAYVSMGHDEYWTPRMRRTVQGARDRGTNLVFLGANTMYWRVRLSPDGRTVTGYRSDSHRDPAHRSRPAEVTARFRDAPAARAEHDLTGMQYECFPVDEPMRIVSPTWWGFAGTGVAHGTELASLVGIEADRVYPDDRTPRPLQVLSHVEYSCGGTPTSAQSVYYTTPSGAGVLNVGTLRWTCALAPSCGRDLFSAATRRFVTTVTATVLREFARGPVGGRLPAVDNVEEFGLPVVNTVPAS